MERIKWVEESRNKNPDIEPKCDCIWTGVVQNRSFTDVSFRTILFFI